MTRPPNIDVGGRSTTLSQPVLRTLVRKTSIPVKRHTVGAGDVDVLDAAPVTPARVWFGVRHNQGDILYIRGSNIDAVNEWLVLKGLAVGDIEGEPALAVEGVVLDYIGDITLEQPEFIGNVQTEPPVNMGGYHVNVRIL